MWFFRMLIVTGSIEKVMIDPFRKRFWQRYLLAKRNENDFIDDAVAPFFKNIGGVVVLSIFEETNLIG